MWHIFICEVYSGTENVRQKIWTPIKYPSKLVGLCLSQFNRYNNGDRGFKPWLC